MNSSRTVLFLCTGNYYRSRFAEVFFNHLAPRTGLLWHAVSRGFRIDWPGNVGPISPHTAQRMRELGIDLADARRMPAACSVSDLDACDIVIALKEAEHRPMLAELFSGWESRVTYWNVHDADLEHPDNALRQIEELVSGLIARLGLNDGADSTSPVNGLRLELRE